MLKVSLVTAMLLVGFSGNAASAPLFWELNAQTQAGGATGSGQVITGFFSYDPATGFSTDWSFELGSNALLSGPFPPSCLGGCLISSSTFDPTTHSVVYETCFLAGGICYSNEVSTASSNFDNTFSFSISGHQSLTVLQLELTQPLTDGGGPIPLIPAASCIPPGGPPQCDPSSPGSYFGGNQPAGLFFLTPIAGSVTLLPEPESVLYVLFGVAVLAVWRRRQFLKT